MKAKNLSIILILGINIILCLAGCRKDDAIYFTTLEKLYLMDPYVQISECMYHNERVYSVFPNAYDAGADIYDDKGNRIGTCGWAWSYPAGICQQLQDCIVIYRCHNFITGQPFVDVYGLSN